ncbi:MAG: hypothetical protein COV75_08835 [Candidatus Omnitrophica bacterium CG11_big_fil_rev_8_21_14_0_20_63_9]|nr:MAG: hypothetical protein COV75_08835 [Candidatus Omnitrophica bacterium CG11_big_fil_rev_8_21_14_0_20_63_9]
MFSSPTIGVEIGAHVLKAAWAMRKGGRLTWRYRQQVRRDHADAHTLSEDLAALLKPWRRERFHARLILAAPNSYVRRLTVRAATARTIGEAVQARLPSLLPFDAAQAHVRFDIEAQRPAGDEVEATVLVSACDRAAAQELLDALWHAGWPVAALVPAGAALHAAVQELEAEGKEPAVLLELGARQTTIALIDDGCLLCARDVAIGDEHLTDALTGEVNAQGRTIALTVEQARVLKTQIGIPESGAGVSEAELPLPLGVYLSMVQPILEQVVAEVRRTMALTGDAPADSSPQRLLLTGDGSRLPNLPHWLSGQLGVPVVRLQCEKLLGEAGANATIPCGLVWSAQGRVSSSDLQPAPSRRRAVIARAASRTWKFLLLATALAGVATWSWRDRQRTAAEQVAALETRWETLRPVEDLQATATQEHQVLQRLTEASVRAMWFRQLAEEFPGPVRLNRLVMTAEGSVNLAGQAQGWEQTPEAALSELTLWLEQVEICRDVQLESSQRGGGVEGAVEFSLTCERP